MFIEMPILSSVLLHSTTYENTTTSSLQGTTRVHYQDHYISIYPFRPAYACSITKVQGHTLGNITLRIDTPRTPPGTLYVALLGQDQWPNHNYLHNLTMVAQKTLIQKFLISHPPESAIMRRYPPFALYWCIVKLPLWKSLTYQVPRAKRRSGQRSKHWQITNAVLGQEVLLCLSTIYVLTALLYILL